MLRTALFRVSLIVAAVLIPGLAVQVPLSSAHFPQPKSQRHANNAEWSLDKLPNPNDTDHLVFETVHSLLLQWPNTRMRNGHTIVPGRIPPGTLLYHGRTTKELPSGPEWVATDPDHSYIFCREILFPHLQPECWHLTLATTRSLKIVYFDGSSAAKLPYGSMDTQYLIGWGSVGSHDPMNDEWDLVQDLCKWGKKFGVDGFVRMQFDFEVVLCDFTSGVSLVSFANLVNQQTSSPTSDSATFETINAGSWHSYFPGETRVRLDLTGLVSFYDMKLAPSLIDIRAGQERWDHRVANISGEDWLAAKSRLEEILVKPEGTSSRIDWMTHIHVIVNRYAGRLELTRYLLSSTVTDSGDIVAVARKVQTQLRIMLTPYLLSSAVPTDKSDNGNLNWSIPIYRFCATTHMPSMESEISSMTDSEKLLLRSILGTTREICRVVTKMWASGVNAGIDPLSKDSLVVMEIIQLWSNWVEDLERLMGWLDWGAWVKCDPGCGPEEMCYLPSWPYGFPETVQLVNSSFASQTMVGKRFPGGVRDIVEAESDDWIRPQPRCIRRVEPYSF